MTDGTKDDAIFERNGDKLDTDDIHSDAPMKAILRSCLKILKMIWVVNVDR